MTEGSGRTDVTRLLERVGGGDRAALDALIEAVYGELRHLASAHLRKERSGHTLSATALVHEAWLKLAKSPPFATASALHFKRIAARAMRQVLIEAARRRRARKRGGDDGVVLIAFDPAVMPLSADDDQLLALDAALDRLASFNPRQATMVESRFFGGLDIPETAALLQVSEATILRDWRAARAWLAHELRRG